MNEYIAKIYTKFICNILSGRFDVHLQVIQPILKFPYLISFIKYPKRMSFEIRKSLKRMPLLAYTEMDETKYRVSSMHYLDTVIYVCISWLLMSDSRIIGNENGIPLR